MINIVIVLSVLCSSIAHVTLKVGMSVFNEQTLPTENYYQNIFYSIATNYYIIGGMFLHVLALLSWLYVLKHVEVSYAYPFISLGFIFVLFVGYYFLDETINTYRLLGILLISAGVFFVSRS